MENGVNLYEVTEVACSPSMPPPALPEDWSSLMMGVAADALLDDLDDGAVNDVLETNNIERLRELEDDLQDNASGGGANDNDTTSVSPTTTETEKLNSLPVSSMDRHENKFFEGEEAMCGNDEEGGSCSTELLGVTNDSNKENNSHLLDPSVVPSLITEDLPIIQHRSLEEENIALKRALSLVQSTLNQIPFIANSESSSSSSPAAAVGSSGWEDKNRRVLSSHDRLDNNDSKTVVLVVPTTNNSSHHHHQEKHGSQLINNSRHLLHSYNVDGLSKETVMLELEKSKPHHARSIEEAKTKSMRLLRPQSLLEDYHEETFYELFYDLILAVVFIKLSYLKYDLTFEGALSVGALFANFWSCWSLLNVYVSMLHTEDVLHRAYYVAHIIASFFMAISIQNPEFTTFNFHYMVN